MANGDGRVKVFTTDLDTAISNFDRELRQILAAGDALDAHIKALGGVWMGSASDAYAQAYLRWKRGYDESVDVLKQLQTSVAAARDHHASAEAARAAGMTVGSN
jgi:WXG100 family type VII secretion target